MENRMDRQSQSLGDQQVSSSESELPSLSVLSQEPLTASPELRLFKRITRWTLLLGIMLGCCLTLFGIELFGAQLNISGSTIAHLLGPLMIISLGATGVLRWRVQRLRAQLTTFQSNIDSSSSQMLLGLVGIALIGIGSFTLIGISLNIPSNVALPILSIGGVGSIILICSITLYISLRSDRRTTKR